MAVMCWMSELDLIVNYVLDVLQEVLVLLRQLLLDERVMNGCVVIDLEVGHCGKRSGSVVRDVDVV
eukprot:3405805-Amphidinium_carterae.3